MSIDSSVISYVVAKPMGLAQLQQAGITSDHLTDTYQKAWRFCEKQKRLHGHVPSKEVIAQRYPDLELHKVRKRDLPTIVHEVIQRRKFMDLMEALDETARIGGPDDIDFAISNLQGRLNDLSLRNGSSSMIDAFSAQNQERMLQDRLRRRDSSVRGIPTGLKRFDIATGGLQKGRLVVVMGRPGLGKSWLNLLFVASAVRAGFKVGLYPLEMTLEDTCLRLYSIFSCGLMGADKALRNLDLANGRVSKTKMVRLMNMLEDRFKGQLFIADVGAISDPYTVERIEAEQQVYKFDLQWIDYLTLMKTHNRNGDAEDYLAVKQLSNGCKQIATRHKSVMGVSAQVNRGAVAKKIFLPRLEDIAYGDSIGQDADHCIPINRKSDDLYYALTKNRHGPEFGAVRVKFAVNIGNIEEYERQEQDEDEE